MGDANNKYINLLEEISLNAWPSHKMELYDGWLIRFSHNYTHRTNSVQQVGASRIPTEEKIAYCEEIYTSLHTPTIFKISPLIDPDFDTILARMEYEKQHVTWTMCMEMKDFVPYAADDVEYEFYGRNSGLPSNVSYSNGAIVQLRDTITEDWVKALFRLNGTTNATLRRIVPSMYGAIPKETIVAKIEIDGHMVASGLGILDRGHCGVYAIYVDPACRGQQYGRAIVSTILTEAEKMGCDKAYLQIKASNEKAEKLYESLGFHKFYQYWFRSKDLTIPVRELLQRNRKKK